VVSYTGGNRQRLHHHVVRGLPGGADGFRLATATATKSAKIDLTALRRTLHGYLTQFEEQQGDFPDAAWPLDFKKLKVIALIQNDETKQILQAVQMDVPEER